MIPDAVLIARAVNFLEAAQMELTAGNYDRASINITAAVEYLEKVGK